MKAATPFNVWVYHRADGKITLGQYIRAKRHVFATLPSSLTAEQLFNDNDIKRLVDFSHDVGRLLRVETQYGQTWPELEEALQRHGVLATP